MKQSFREVVGILCLLIALATLPNMAYAAESGGMIQNQGGSGGQPAGGSPAVPLASVTDIVYLTGGCAQSYALESNGIVWAWGDNYWGELGDGTMTSHAAPKPVKSLKGVQSIASGGCHSLALQDDGTVWEWGVQQPYGSDQDSTPGPTPLPVKDTSGQAFGPAVAIAAGVKHQLAIKRDGTVWAWGKNDSGQLGDGTVLDEYAYVFNPVQAQGLDSVVAVAAGVSSSLALKSDGTVWAWGSGSASSIPVQVQGLDSVVAVAAGALHNMALRNDGTVWTWGQNSYGQLGDGSTTARSAPAQVQGLDSVVAITAGAAHSLALRNDGTVWTWGGNNDGELGDGSTVQRSTPAQVHGLDSVTSISAGDYHNLILKSDGTAWGWGVNSRFELGEESGNNHYLPIEIQGLGKQGPETLLYRFPGMIVDYDANRILWRQVESYWDKGTYNSRYVYWLYNRSDQSQARVFEDAKHNSLARVRLSSEGVVYEDGSAINVWKDGAVQHRWPGYSGYRLREVNGDFAVLGSNVLNVKTGESRALPNAELDFTSNRRYDLSADGTIVYTSRNQPSNLYKSLPNGKLITYEPTSPDSYTFFGPLTDGRTLVYSELLQKNGSSSKWALRVRGADDRIATLAMNPYDRYDTNAEPKNSYQINNGWIAYKKADEETGRWLLELRSPEGATQQAYAAPPGSSWIDVPLSIKQLAPDGTLAYTYQNTTYVYSAQAGKILYSFYDPGELGYKEHVMKDPAGGDDFRFLSWYRLDGGLLYGVRL